jgi:hypothetical protein
MSDEYTVVAFIHLKKFYQWATILDPNTGSDRQGGSTYSRDGNISINSARITPKM